MKFSKFVRKLYNCVPCTSSKATTSIRSSDAPTLPDIPQEATFAAEIDTESIAATSALTPSLFTDPSLPPSRMLSQRSTAPSFGTINLISGAMAVPSDELMLDNHPDAPPGSALSPISEEKPSTNNDTDEVTALKAEIEMLELVSQRQQDDIIKLSHDLEREHHINFELQQSKFCRPRKLKKQIKRLKAQVHAKETEVDEWRRKYAKLARTAGLRDDIAGTKDLLEKSVSELEAQAAGWRKRMEDVANMSRQVERKGRGLGMWWTRDEFDEATAGID
jgi:hypothetical protein